MGSKGEWNFVKEASLPSRVLYEKKTARAFKNNLQEKEENTYKTDRPLGAHCIFQLLSLHIAMFDFREADINSTKYFMNGRMTILK